MSAEGVLDRVVRAHCLDPARPWALAHGLLVYGRSETLPDGTSPVDRLVSDSLIAETRLFPQRRAGLPVEPHPGMFLKTLLEVGVLPERSFTLPGGAKVTMADLIEAHRVAYAKRDPAPKGSPVFHNEAWMFEVLAYAGPPAGLREQVLEALIENQAYFEPYLEDPKRPYSKPYVKVEGRPQPAHIHRYFCGGFHLFQGVQRLHGQTLPATLRRQYEILLFRLERETAYWDGKLVQVQERFKGAELAGHRRIILSQKLKLQGHALETYLRAVKDGVFSPDESAKRQVAGGFLHLERTVMALESSGIYAELPAIRERQLQLYLDLVGDSAHALHAYGLHGR